MNVGGKSFTAGFDLLTSVKGSKMTLFVKDQMRKNQGFQINLDRDPEIFNYILKYLRSER